MHGGWRDETRSATFPDRETELWVPTRFTTEQLTNHGNHLLQVVARLKPGVPLKTANADLATIAAQLEKENPESNAKVGAFAVPLREELAGDVRPAILMLVGAVCFVLLIACANVANLLLSRATGRRPRAGHAPGSRRDARPRDQAGLTESILLSLFAGAVGLLLSVWGTKFLATLIPAGIAPMAGTGVDARVLLFTLAISLSTGILFGIIPASRVSQFHLTYSLKQGGGQSGVGSGGHRLRDALVVCEVALAIVLLAGAALLNSKPSESLSSRSGLSGRSCARDAHAPAAPKIRSVRSQGRFLRSSSRQSGNDSRRHFSQLRDLGSADELRRRNGHHHRGKTRARAGKSSDSQRAHRQPGLHEDASNEVGRGPRHRTA